MIRNLLDHPVNLAIVVLVIVVLVGWKKMPDAARSLGRSMRIFKSEVEEMKKDGKTTPSAASSDTVRGETVRPAADPIPDPIPTQDPPQSATTASTEREKNSSPPA